MSKFEWSDDGETVLIHVLITHRIAFECFDFNNQEVGVIMLLITKNSAIVSLWAAKVQNKYPRPTYSSGVKRSESQLLICNRSWLTANANARLEGRGNV